VLHLAEYVLIVVCVHALAGRVTQNDGTRVRLSVGTGIVIAILDESIQRLVPSRSVEAFDLVANGAGVLLGWTLVARPRRLAAIAAATVALAAGGYVAWDTRSSLADFSRGIELERQRDFVRAREHFQLALAAGLRSPGLFNELGWVEIESGVGDPAKAVDYATTALELDPGNPNVVDTYGWALLHVGRTKESLTALKRAYAASPEMYCIHYHLGAAYLASGQRAEARFHFERQLDKPRTREAAFARDALQKMRGDH
jgi:tetratricopeptide (TPR) repeat protein